MNNKYLRKLIILLFVFTLPMCNNLEENLVDELTTDISSPIYDCSCGGFPLSAYEEIRFTGIANHGGYYSIQEISSDEMTITAKGQDWFDGGIFIDLHQHTYKPSNIFLNNTWQQIYQAINRLNEVLHNDNVNNADEEAQARALRAYYYLRLLDLFGNVKLITNPEEEGAQVSRSELFRFVETELLAAIGIPEITATMDLSDSPLVADANPYRINQFGALGLLAKLYLNAEVYAGQAFYEEAAIAASYIIDSGVYHLCGVGCKVTNLGKRNGVSTDPDELEGFAAVFAPNNEDNPEHIFTVAYDELGRSGMNFSQMNLHYGSQSSYTLADQPWNGYAVLEEFYNAFEENDTRKEASFLVGPQLDFGGNAILDYESDDDNIVLNYTPQIDELAPNAKREAGVRAKKFSYKQFGQINMDNDYPIIRLGEIYLIRGEALARNSGDWNLAIPDVNILRARANVFTYATLTETEFLAERGREMFQESSRRTDLIRFDKYNEAWWEKPADLSNHVNIFPIPLEQIQASEGTLVQNPGY